MKKGLVIAVILIILAGMFFIYLQFSKNSAGQENNNGDNDNEGEESNENIIEKQIYGLYPTAEVSRAKDYNIFNPQGATAGAYLSYNNYPILPIKTYKKMESDPIGGILTAMSKLQAESEGAAMQVLIRPSHADSQKSLATKVAREMQSGYQFKEAMQRAQHPPKALSTSSGLRSGQEIKDQS